MSQWDFNGPPAGGHEYDEYGEYRGYRDGGTSDEFDGGAFSPISYERDPYPPGPGAGAGTDRWAGEWPYDEPGQHTAPLPTAPRPSSQAGELWRDESWPPRLPPRPSRPRWLIPGAVVAVAAAAVGATIVALSGGGHPASQPPGTGTAAPRVTAQPSTAGAGAGAGARQPLTLAQARQVLAGYTAANNRANARMSDSLLATIETSSSYAIDSGIYRVQQAERSTPYPAFGPKRAAFYIPRQSPAAYPHWFVVQVVNASLASPGKSTGTEYLVFTQAAPGAPWLNTVEPYVVGGATPGIATSADGLAIPVSATGTALAVQPASIAAVTAAALDGGQGGAPAAPAAPVALASPANLADRLDEAFWRKQIPAAAVTDRHAPAPGTPVFGLATTDGGALLFYTDAAELTLSPPAGEALHLTIPGFYSPGQSLSTAGIGYLEQFATYVPPRGGSGLRVVADYSGITSRN
jgi:hypothetical protein